MRLPSPRLGPAVDDAPCGLVEADDLLERPGAAVVEVGRGQGHITERGRAELAHVARVASDLEEATVAFRVRTIGVEVVEPGVVERCLGEARPLMDGRVTEVEAAVAVVTLGALGEEQRHATHF